MNEKVAPIPAGFTTITPHLLVKDAEEAFAFYQKAFGAKELSRQTHPSENWLLHLDLKIGNSILMLSGTSQGVDAFELAHTRQSTGYNRSIASLCRRCRQNSTEPIEKIVFSL